jgi:hypothetical protein
MTVPMWYYLTLVLIMAYNYDNKEYLKWFIYYVVFMTVEDWDDTLMCVYIKYLVLYWSKVYCLYGKYFKIYVLAIILKFKLNLFQLVIIKWGNVKEKQINTNCLSLRNITLLTKMFSLRPYHVIGWVKIALSLCNASCCVIRLINYHVLSDASRECITKQIECYRFSVLR